MTSSTDSPVVWGAKGIARIVNLSPAAVFHLLEEGRIPARKVGNRWCANRDELVAHLRANGGEGGAQ